MKKLFLIMVILTIFTIGVFAQNGSVIIRNETGYTIDFIYFSPSNFDDWGDDLLEGNMLADGEEIEINLDRDIDEGETVYDLQAVDEDEDYYTIYETDILDNPVVSITMEAYDGGDYDDYDDYDYSGYEDGYNEGYTEGYREGYREAFRDAYLEGFKAAMEMDDPSYGAGSGNEAGGWR